MAPEASTELPFYTLTLDETVSRLTTNLATGLAAAEAKERLVRHGPNEFAKKQPPSLAVRFLRQFKNVLIILLIVAAAISGVVGQINGEGWADSIIILAIVILNACIGVVQETKAEKALDALEKMSAPQCRVVRDGVVSTIPAREVVPGDVALIETGDLVPADLRLTEAVNLKVQEAALTGESEPAEKRTDPVATGAPPGDQDNMAFSSSTVVYGRGRGVVTATGMGTEVGKIASMLQSAPDTKTPLQVKIDSLGKYLGIAAVVVCVVIFAAGLLQGRDMLEMFMIAVSLAAAAIPEGLPAVSTIVLAVGVRRLAACNAIVRNLPSVETLGSASVICSDKTGTLTQNRMSIVKLASGDGEPADVPQQLSSDQQTFLTAAILANDGAISREDDEKGGWKSIGDPTETAFLILGADRGLNKNEMEQSFPRQSEVPFDSERKMMSTVNRGPDGKLTVYLKGGVEEVMARSVSILRNGETVPLDDAARAAIRQHNSTMSNGALRVLAAASRPLDSLPEKVDSAGIETDLTWLGMAGIIDPPRPEVKQAVAECRSAGIKPVMITGDHLNTAVAIARELGIGQDGDDHFTGAELAGISDEELNRRVENASVFARVAPEHKVRIVKAYQSHKEVVAMTGDGVNDAPALKLADIGLAMGITGTDVSKEAADMVLADDNFATIVNAVREGRRIYDNILKAIQFMLSTNLAEILVILTAILLKWPSPLMPIQILWINLVTDSLPALALSVDPADPDVMQRQPVRSDQGILHGAYLIRIILQGIMIAALSLAAFIIGRRTDVETGRTTTFAVLALAQITHVLNVRSARYSALRGLFSNRLLLGALAVVLTLMLGVLEIPSLHEFFYVTHLSTAQWIWVAVLSLAPLPLVEVVKLIHRLVDREPDVK